MQKKLFVIGIVCSCLFACKSRVAVETIDSTSVSLTFVQKEGESFYDSIAPPIPRIDTLKFYSDLKRMLAFSDNLKRDEDISLSSFSLSLDVDGKARLRGDVSSSKDVEKDMEQVANYVMLNLKEWRPAFNKRDSTVKVPFLINVHFYFKKDIIDFEVESSMDDYNGLTFFKKSFLRPIAKKDY